MRTWGRPGAISVVLGRLLIINRSRSSRVDVEKGTVA
jgi:hypothetical protein